MVYSPTESSQGCSCDPAVITTDCTQKPCTPFFSFFLSLQCIILILYVVIIVTMEVRKKKGDNVLWRIMISAALVGTLAKILRLGFLANPSTRFRVGQIGLLLLYNTHFCFSFLCFLTLLFFWAKLYHDLFGSSAKLFGKLLPFYILSVFFVIIFFYGQVVALAMTGTTYFFFPLMGGGISFFLAVAFLIYSVFMWKRFLREYNRASLFFQTFISVIIVSTITVILVIDLVIGELSKFNTTTDYLIKHSIYETLFVAIYVALPSGFFVHIFKEKSSQTNSANSKDSANATMGTISKISLASVMDVSLTADGVPEGCELGWHRQIMEGKEIEMSSLDTDVTTPPV